MEDGGGIEIGGRDLQDLEALLCPRQTHVDGAVEAAGAQQGIVQGVLPVGSPNHQHLQAPQMNAFAAFNQLDVFLMLWETYCGGPKLLYLLLKSTPGRVLLPVRTIRTSMHQRPGSDLFPLVVIVR